MVEALSSRFSKILAPGDHMRAGDGAQFGEAAQTGESDELIDIVLVGTARVSIGDVGEPFELGAARRRLQGQTQVGDSLIIRKLWDVVLVLLSVFLELNL